MARRETAARGERRERARTRAPRQHDAAREDAEHFEDTNQVQTSEPADQDGYEDDQYESDEYAVDEYREAERSGGAGTGEGSSDADESSEPAPRAVREGRVTTAGAAAQVAIGQIAELTGKQPEGITAVEPADDGWLVGVETVEDRRVPSSADILAIYEAAVDPDGTLISYRRTRRYSRGRGDDGGEAR